MAKDDEKQAPPGKPFEVPDVTEGVIQMSDDEARLAGLGYKQEFYRHLGFFGMYTPSLMNRQDTNIRWQRTGQLRSRQ